VADIVRSAVPRREWGPVEPVINVANGMLDWSTHKLVPHDWTAYSSTQLPVKWNPDAECKEFDAWLAEVVPPDCVELAWEIIGYLAYSGNPLHTAIMLMGTGRNGKGTFLRVVKSLLGERNIATATLAGLTGNRFTPATLHGKLANIAGDIDATYLESTAMFKAITGDDMIYAEHKHGQPFTFTPWAVPVFSANKVPASADTTAGYLSRWLILPFPNSFEGSEDRTVDARLSAELPGILASAVRRLPGLLARGQWVESLTALDAKAEFNRRVDQVRYWLSECTERYPSEAWAKRSDLYEAYKRWTVRDGGKPVRASEFYDRLNGAGYAGVKLDDGARVYRGLKITDQAHFTVADYMR
jgi:P4 family phage/plasmid primase-like protien